MKPGFMTLRCVEPALHIRARAANLALKHETDAHVFWVDRDGDQLLFNVDGWEGYEPGLTELLRDGGLCRWIWWPEFRQLLFPMPSAKQAEGIALVASMEALVGRKLTCEARPVREERLDPLTYELVVCESVDLFESGEQAPDVGAWVILVPRSPARQFEVRIARQQMFCSLNRLLELWRTKTGRESNAEQVMMLHRLLLAAGCPAVVSSEPEGAKLEWMYIYKADDEPDLVLALFRHEEAGGRRAGYLRAQLAWRVEPGGQAASAPNLLM